MAFETRKEFVEQEFQPQECAYSFAEGLFVNYVWHVASLKYVDGGDTGGYLPSKLMKPRTRFPFVISGVLGCQFDH